MAAGGAIAAFLVACAPTPAATLTPATWCEGFERERLDPVARMSGRNRERLEAAQALVAPGLGRTRAISGLSLLGGYQEEMQRARPDVATAAAYLATASAVPLAVETIGQVNGLLCVTTTARRAAELAAMAAAMQREMLAEARS